MTIFGIVLLGLLGALGWFMLVNLGRAEQEKRISGETTVIWIGVFLAFVIMLTYAIPDSVMVR